MPERILRLGIDPGQAVRGSREFARATDRAGDAAARLDRRVEESQQKFVTLQRAYLAAGAALAAGLAGAALGTRKLLEIGAAAEETANKFDVVMGASAERVRQRFEELSDVVPLTRAEMERMSGSIQDMLVPMGLARAEAADFSAQAVELAADIASFNNVATDDVLRAYQSALAGQSEPMRRFGIDTRETRLELLALEEGLIGQGQELDNATRAQAVFLAIQRDSADAMGDAARTAEDTSNAARLLDRDVRQLAEDTGGWATESLAASGAMAELRDVFADLGGLVRENEDLIRSTFVGGFELAADAARLVSYELTGLVTVYTKFVDLVEGADRIGQNISGLFGIDGPEAERALSGFEQGLVRAIEAQRTGREEAEFMLQVTDELRQAHEADARAQEVAAAARASALQDEVDTLTQAADLDVAKVQHYERLLELQRQLQGVLDDETASINDQVTAAEQLASVVEGIGDFRRNNPLFAPVPETGIAGLNNGFGPGTGVRNAAGVSGIADLSNLNPTIRSLGMLDREIKGLDFQPMLSGFASVADHMGLLDGASRNAVRGLSDAVSGFLSLKEAGDLGSVAGIGGALGIAGGVAGLLSSIFSDDEAQRVEAARDEFEAALDRFVDGITDRSRWQQLQANAEDQAISVAESMVNVFLESVGSDTARGHFEERFGALFEAFEDGSISMEQLIATLEQIFGDDAQRILEAYRGHLERIAEQRQAEIAAMEEGYEVRRLVAQGLDDEAAAKRIEIQQQQELAEALALGGEELQAFVAGIHEFEDAAREAAKQAERDAEEKRRADQENASRAEAQARLFEAQGYQEQADAIRRNAERQEILTHALDVGGEALRDYWQEVFRAEDAARKAAAAERALAESREAAARRQSLSDDLGIRRARLDNDPEEEARIRRDAERREAQEAFDAGEIPLRLFREWIDVINDEFTEAVRAAAEATREAAEAERFRQQVDTENLRVRLLLAQGRDREAQALRNQLEILEAINDERSAEYVNLLRQIHAQEMQNQAQQEATRAIEETQRTLENFSRALNNPSGVNLNLRRYQASQLGDPLDLSQFGGGGGAFGVSSPDFSQPITSGQVQNLDQKVVVNGGLTLNVQANPEGRLDIDGIRRQVQEIVRAGGTNPLVGLNV